MEIREILKVCNSFVIGRVVHNEIQKVNLLRRHRTETKTFHGFGRYRNIDRSYLEINQKEKQLGECNYLQNS